ncbi:glycosyltransferase [Candidatus Pelagibacter bacterium]|nr:glycosyltransferase [Candidatus Pelagibacter bacterium]
MISIILPCFNEQDSIKDYIEAVNTNLNKLKFEYEIIVVNDGSTDKSVDKIKETQAKLISHPQNLGYGAALKSGIKYAKYDTIIMTDPDGTYPAEHMKELIEIYFNSAKNSLCLDMVIGARKGKVYDGSLIKFFMRKILKFLVEWTTGTKIIDINSGMRIFSKKTINSFLPQLCNTFSFSTSLTLAYFLTGKFVRYHPIKYHVRAGKSHVKIFRDSLRTLQYIVEAIIYYNPLKLTLLISSFFFLISFLLGVLFLIKKSTAILILACLSILITFISIFFGFLMDLLRQTFNKTK